MINRFGNIRKSAFLFATILFVVLSSVTMLPDTGSANGTDIIEDAGWLGDLDVMKEKGAIRVLVPVSNPFFLVDGFHKYGLTVDRMKEFEQFVNKEMKTGVFLRIILIPVSRSVMFDRLLNGYGDLLAANLTITPERQQLVDFADPVAKDINEIVVAATDAPALSSLEDLSGKVVSVRKQSSYYEHLLQVNDTFREKGLPPISVDFISDDLDDGIVLAMIDEGLLEYTVMDQWKPGFWKEKYPACVSYPDIQVSTNGQIAWAIRKESPLLKDLLNRFVTFVQENVSVDTVKLHELVDKDLLKFTNLNPELWAKFRNNYPLFQEMGEKYNVDAKWLAALAYGSSEFNQEKIGRNGELGMMQLAPFIARLPEIDIVDINLLRNNVEAAAKYLRYLLDSYFNGPEMTERDRYLFAVAAYHIGPEKIKTYRWISEQSGHDANKWLNEVVVEVSRRMGRETARFVSVVGGAVIAYQRALRSGKKKWSVD